MQLKAEVLESGEDFHHFFLGTFSGSLLFLGRKFLFWNRMPTLLQLSWCLKMPPGPIWLKAQTFTQSSSLKHHNSVANETITTPSITSSGIFIPPVSPLQQHHRFAWPTLSNTERLCRRQFQSVTQDMTHQNLTWTHEARQKHLVMWYGCWTKNRGKATKMD